MIFHWGFCGVQNSDAQQRHSGIESDTAINRWGKPGSADVDGVDATVSTNRKHL
jgi:hypothetical protein